MAQSLQGSQDLFSVHTDDISLSDLDFGSEIKSLDDKGPENDVNFFLSICLKNKLACVFL